MGSTPYGNELILGDARGANFEPLAGDAFELKFQVMDLASSGLGPLLLGLAALLRRRRAT